MEEAIEGQGPTLAAKKIQLRRNENMIYSSLQKY